MKVYPPSAEDKLGFEVLRRRLDDLALSRLGQDRLGQMRPSSNPEWVEAELARVGELQEALRFDDPVPLDSVLDVREVVRRITPEEAYAPPEDLLALRLVLATTRRLKSYFAQREGKYPHLAERVRRITALQALEDRIAEVVDADGRMRDDASPELFRLRRLIVQRQSQLRETLMRALREAAAQGYAIEEQPTIRSGRMVIPVRAEAKRKVQGFVHDVSASGQTVYIEPAASLDLNNEVRELESEERREVERVLKAVAARLREHTGEMQGNLRVLAEFDLLQAKAHLANQLDAQVPQLNDDGVIDIRDGRSPLLVLHFASQQKEGEAPREVVPLDLTLGDDFQTLVITGPNAGGKTVAMKTVGLFALMTAYGLPIPADALSQMSLFDKLIVDIGDEQSIEEDLSTFTSHVSNLKHMLAQADVRTLVLIDEAGTGTDPAEGGALAQAVLERLTDVGARTIVTTHHGTLKAFAHNRAGLANGSMQFDQATLTPAYRFQKDIPGSSFAFEIAGRIGLDASILTRARELVGEQKTALEELIADFETRNQDLADRLAESEEMLKRAEHERQQYRGRAEKLRKEREAIRQQALEEAERIVSGANARVERTIREIKEAQAEREMTHQAREELERYQRNLQKKAQNAARRTRREQTDRSVTPKPSPTSGSTNEQERRRNGSARRDRSEMATPQRSPSLQRGEDRLSGPLRAGDQVVLDGGTTSAEVLEIEGDEAVIALGSMRLRTDLERLTKVGGPRRQQVTVRQPARRAGDLAAVKAQRRIDVRGQRVDEVVPVVERFVDDAVAANLDRVEILHGKGTGALRQAIRERLADLPGIADFDDAPWDEGGPGVTYVTLR